MRHILTDAFKHHRKFGADHSHWRAWRRSIWMAWLVFIGASPHGIAAAGDAAGDLATFEESRKLATDGQIGEAFRKYLAVPGGEFAAATLGRSDSAKFLALLRQEAQLMKSPRARLVEAELLLASGRKDEAKARFHLLATTAPKDNWGTGQSGYYPVEPPGMPGDDDPFAGFAAQRPALPFLSGPGSHRDNWLLRRLIALDLTDDAALEFARLWEVHRANAKPYLIAVTSHATPSPAMRYHAPGFDSSGLQFALDYAFFLKRAGRTADALEVLLEPLRVMDMDRNPNRASLAVPPVGLAADLPVRKMPEHALFRFSPGLIGVARKEFIRLAFGEFKIAENTAKLLAELQQALDRGENRARRVLAQVKLHQGLTSEALALELAYIEHGNFDPLSTAYRRGMVFEEYRQPAEAVAAFEQVLAAKLGELQLPDADERVSDAPQFESSAYFPQEFGAHGDVREILTRLYAALGRTDKVLEMQFSRFDADERRLEDLEQIEQMAERFKTAGQEARFNEWAAGKLATAKSPLARANLAWQQRDLAAAITHAVAIEMGGFPYWRQWRTRFAALNRERELEFMRALVRTHPEDAVARLELLDIEDHLDGPEAIAALEALLASDAGRAFQSGKGVSNRTSFKSYYDLAYRLMRLYEKNNQLDKLRTLGLRLAMGDPPFANFDAHSSELSGENGREEFGNACLALAVQYADAPAYQAELAAALKTSRWIGARAQLARRTNTAPAAKGGDAPPWANLPRDVRVVVSCESVACVARNERFVYVGLPWGVAVYDFNGAPVTRILLGKSVTTLVAVGDQLWAGTDGGLFCIQAESWEIAHEALGKITALGLDGDQLWIGVANSMDNGLMVLNRHTLALRTFSAEEVGLERTMDFTRFESDGKYMWADNYYGLLRYDRSADSWSAQENPGPRDPVHLIGIIDGQVWVDVWLDDEMRHRPARLDRETLRVTPLHLTGPLTRDRLMINTRLSFHGHHHGQPAFTSEGGSWGRFVVEKDSKTIRRLREADANGPEVISDPLPDGLRLPDGRVFRVPANAWSDGLRAGVRSTRWEDRWPRDAVWAVLFDDTRDQDWLCVGAGLAVMPRDGTGLRHFGSADGLTRGPVLDGVELGGNLYFASAWDDHRGSLTIYRPTTGVFTPWFRVDGMDSDKVVGLAAKDGQLELRYGVDYPGDDTDNRLAPGRFNPATGEFTSGGRGTIQPVKGKLLAPAINGALPLLGGPAYRSYERAGATWHCGSRGLVIFPGREAPVLDFAPMKVRHVPNFDLLQRADAEELRVPYPIPLALLKELASHPNRHVRVKALATNLQNIGDEGDIPILIDSLDDPYFKIRAVATIRLANHAGAAAIPGLRKSLADRDFRIRSIAALALAKLGEIPDLAFFDEILAKCGNDNSFALGWDIPIGYSLEKEKVYTVLAPRADRKVFELLLRHQLLGDYYLQKLYPVFGESLRRHPEAAEVLLALQDSTRHGPLRDFAQGVFQHAGKDLLPVLHAALASDDRVVRSNAARACGAIGELSSIPVLIQSLDMESGLARASIVWALGELKARDAVPKLIALHQDARNASHNRQAGSGYLAQQSITASREQYTALRNLDAIASDWDEMKITALRRPRDPRRDEELLTPELVLEAIRKIGPAAAQVFYRSLAAASDSNDRAEAALGLAEPTDRESNLKILRNLADDPVQDVSLRARVSLVLLGEPGADGFLLDRLRTGGEQERRTILVQLDRLSGPQLGVFRQALEAIAKNPREPYLRDLAAALAGKK